MRWTDLKECCDYYNINYKSLCTYMQKNKISKEEAFSHYYQYYKYKQYGINVQSVHSYRFRNKDSDYDEAIDYIRKITKQRQFIWEDGSVYESINSFCRMKSISVSSVRDKARKKGMSLQEAAKYYIERNSYD